MFSIYPPDEPKQTLRIQRMLMAASTYVLLSNLAWVAYLAGLVRNDIVTIIVGIILALISQAAVYVLLRTGVNKRFKDPSLTTLQILIGICWITYLLSTVSEIRGVLMTLYFLIFLFGAFQLNKSELLKLAAVAMGGFLLVVYLDYSANRPEFSLKISTVQAIILATVMIWLSYMGDYIHAIQEKARRKLRLKTEEFEEQKQAHEKTEQRLARLITAITPSQETSVRDSLTGLLRANEFQKHVNKQLIISDACKTPLAVAAISIQPLQKLENTLSNEELDQLIKDIADAIKQAIRIQDMVCREDSSGFLLLLPNTEKKAAIGCAERLCAEIAMIKAHDNRLKAIVGITSWQEDDSTEIIIKRARDSLSSALESERQIIYDVA